MLKSSYQQLNKSLNGKKESAKEKKDIEYIPSDTYVEN